MRGFLEESGDKSQQIPIVPLTVMLHTADEHYCAYTIHKHKYRVYIFSRHTGHTTATVHITHTHTDTHTPLSLYHKEKKKKKLRGEKEKMKEVQPSPWHIEVLQR